MKAITSEETREMLLEQLRNGVCIELALWSTCLTIEAILNGECDAVSRIFQVGRDYVGIMIDDSHMKEILFGGEEITLNRAVASPKRMPEMANFDEDRRRKLLRVTQTAIWLHSALMGEAEAIAKLVECELDVVTQFISELTIEADIHLEFIELDLKAFLGEPLPDSYWNDVRHLPPIE